MSTHLNTSALHPALMIAAVSVTALSLAGVAKLTGVLPDFGAKPTAAAEAVTPQPPLQETPPSAPVARLEAAPAPAAPKAADAAPAPRSRAPCAPTASSPCRPKRQTGSISSNPGRRRAPYTPRAPRAAWSAA